MGTTSALLIALLAVSWVVLLILTIRPPNTPKLSRLIMFQLLLVVTFVLGYVFLIEVLQYNPNPARVRIARFLTEDKTVYLGDIVPGLYDLSYIHRMDTDGDEERIKEEWLATYQYDVTSAAGQPPRGPFGAAIYDYDDCRPPAILSYELVPVSYDYLAQDVIRVTGDAGSDDIVVENIIKYSDPLSVKDGISLDRPELIVFGRTQSARTDLNVFRKVGVELNCFARQEWQKSHPGESFPNPLRYENIGSFRGNYRVERNGATVTVIDRSPFERSQITIRKQYRPENGTYYREPGSQVLLDPVEYGLAFGPGEPDTIPQVYYPEKAVLAFYLNLTKDRQQLDKANGYLSPAAQATFDIDTDQFGLARPRDQVARVLVWQIRYEPNVAAEQLHQDREVTVEVVGVDRDGNIDYAHPCQVTWRIVGVKNASALPYGCEWRLDSYHTACVPGG